MRISLFLAALVERFFTSDVVNRHPSIFLLLPYLVIVLIVIVLCIAL